MAEMVERVRSAWNVLEQRIGHRFLDRELLVRALTHRSYANESRNPSIGDNERLEFLGDAVLDLIIGCRLYRAHPDADEGELSRLRADLVSEPSLARRARALALGDCLLLGRGEDRSGGRERDSLQADGLEAIIGAVFLDAGYAAAEAVVDRVFTPLLQAPETAGDQDFKTRLQEMLQARRRPRPEYLLKAAHGPDHRRHYEIEVMVAGAMLGRGEGATKKRAEQEAARQALGYLEREERSVND